MIVSKMSSQIRRFFNKNDFGPFSKKKISFPRKNYEKTSSCWVSFDIFRKMLVNRFQRLLQPTYVAASEPEPKSRKFLYYDFAAMV